MNVYNIIPYPDFHVVMGPKVYNYFYPHYFVRHVQIMVLQKEKKSTDPRYQARRSPDVAAGY